MPRGQIGKMVQQVAKAVAASKPRRTLRRAGRKARRAGRRASRAERSSGRRNQQTTPTPRAGIVTNAGRTQQYVTNLSSWSYEPKFKISSRKDGRSIEISGQEYLGSLDLTSDVPAGTILMTIPMTPETTTRFRQMSYLYNAYQFRRFAVIFDPSLSVANSAANGTIGIYYQPDPDAPVPSASVESLKNEFAWESSRNRHITNRFHIEGGQSDTNKMYYIDTAVSDRRFTQQGTIYVVAVTALTGTTNTIGTLYLRYHAILSTPHSDAPNQIMGGRILGGGTMTGANPLGTTPTLDPDSKGIVLNSTPGNFSFTSPGQYLVTMYVVGTGLSAIASPTIVSGAGSSIATIFNMLGSTSTNAVSQTTFAVATDSAVFKVATVTATTVTSSIVSIAKVPIGALGLSNTKKTDIDNLKEEIEALKETLKSIKIKNSKKSFVKVEVDDDSDN